MRCSLPCKAKLLTAVLDLGLVAIKPLFNIHCRPLLMTAWPQMSLVARQQERFSDRWSDCRLRQTQAQLRHGMRLNVTRCSEGLNGPLFVLCGSATCRLQTTLLTAACIFVAMS